MNVRLIWGYVAMLVIPGIKAVAVTPLTPQFADFNHNLQELEQIMSTPDATELQFAILHALGFEPETRSVEERDAKYTNGLLYRATATVWSEECSKVHVDAVFAVGPQGHVAADGLYCLENHRAAFWSTRYQHVTRPPN